VEQRLILYELAIRNHEKPNSESTTQARDEVIEMHARGLTASGRMSAEVADHCAWRGDSVLWLNASRKASFPGASAIDNAVGELCKELDLQLRARGQMALSTRHDAQLSFYPGDGALGFIKHYDTKDVRTAGRKITLLTYLNPPDWCHGGQLVIYPNDGRPCTVEPTAGTVVVLCSDVMHEVLPATASRMALTVWVDGCLLDKHACYMPLTAAPSGAYEQEDKRSIWRRFMSWLW
jgi:SM-20-related protein